MVSAATAAEREREEDARQKQLEVERRKRKKEENRIETRLRSAKQMRTIFKHNRAKAVQEKDPAAMPPMYEEEKSEKTVKQEESTGQRVPQAIECTNVKCKKAIYSFKAVEVKLSYKQVRAEIQKQAKKMNVSIAGSGRLGDHMLPRPNWIFCYHCGQTVRVFDAKVATDKTFARTDPKMAKGQIEIDEIQKIAEAAMAQDFGEKKKDEEKKPRRRSVLDQEEDEEEEGSEEDEEDSDYWGGLGTPSDLSEDGLAEYEAWKAEKAEKEAKADWDKAQSELEKEEIARLEEELGKWDDKLEYAMTFVQRWTEKIDNKVAENTQLEAEGRRLDKLLLKTRHERASLLHALARRINLKRKKAERYQHACEIYAESLWEQEARHWKRLLFTRWQWYCRYEKRYKRLRKKLDYTYFDDLCNRMEERYIVYDRIHKENTKITIGLSAFIQRRLGLRNRSKAAALKNGWEAWLIVHPLLKAENYLVKIKRLYEELLEEVESIGAKEAALYEAMDELKLEIDVIYEVKIPEKDKEWIERDKQLKEEFAALAIDLEQQRKDYTQAAVDRYENTYETWENDIDTMIENFDRVAEDLEKMIEDIRDMHRKRDFRVVERGKGVACQACFRLMMQGDMHFQKLDTTEKVVGYSVTEKDLNATESYFYKRNLRGSLNPNDKIHRALIDVERDPFQMRPRNQEHKSRPAPRDLFSIRPAVPKKAWESMSIDARKQLASTLDNEKAFPVPKDPDAAEYGLNPNGSRTMMDVRHDMLSEFFGPQKLAEKEAERAGFRERSMEVQRSQSPPPVWRAGKAFAGKEVSSPYRAPSRSPDRSPSPYAKPCRPAPRFRIAGTTSGSTFQQLQFGGSISSGGTTSSPSRVPGTLNATISSGGGGKISTSRTAGAMDQTLTASASSQSRAGHQQLPMPLQATTTLSTLEQSGEAQRNDPMNLTTSRTLSTTVENRVGITNREDERSPPGEEKIRSPRTIPSAGSTSPKKVMNYVKQNRRAVRQMGRTPSPPGYERDKQSLSPVPVPNFFRFETEPKKHQTPRENEAKPDDLAIEMIVRNYLRKAAVPPSQGALLLAEAKNRMKLCYCLL
ncbi:unnamed protein product [Amoebophrya sp. A120]|nr:unnamed protein product [Amoebophrya sp. A120]|eukprot:GSA120T00022995001.1